MTARDISLRQLVGDGVCESEDICPGIDDATDTDGDGVAECIDRCPGVDDTVFGDCDGAIPTATVWGLTILALLLLCVAKISFGSKVRGTYEIRARSASDGS